jgi:hypothetical protein
VEGLRLAALAAMALGGAVGIFAQTRALSTAVPANAGAASARALTDQYCTVCHDQQQKTGGVSLEGMDFTRVGANADVLEKVARKVKSGQMPPAGMPRPTAAVTAGFVKWLEDALDRNAALNPNPGRPAAHRLNRSEYSNAIRDLLGLDIQAGATLPVDDSGYGFDNIGDVLSVSPALLERYMSAARRVSRLAVGDPGMKPGEEEFSARTLTGGRSGRNERISDDLPFDSRGGESFQYYFPLDAEYQIRVKVNNGGDAAAPFEIRLPVRAGLRTVGVSFPRENTKAEIANPGGRGGSVPGAGRGAPAAPPPPAEMDLRLDGAGVKRFEVKGGGQAQLDKVTIAGPYNVTGRGETPSRDRIFVCRPSTTADETPCARIILSGLAKRAFRRPVTDADVKPLMAFYEAGRADGDFDHGVEMALRALLVSPDFLFRIERDPAGKAAGSVVRVSDFDLASRLSFFLWSSVPDDQLMDLAARGTLHDPAVLEQQVRRMLDDERSQALVTNFAGQWLYLRNLAGQRPDPDAFPEFDESLRQAFRQETDLFFQSFLREDRSVTEMLDANYTYLNQRLAEHYGVPNVYGSQFRRVTLNDPNRGGLLGQGSILTVTSYPDRTSVVQRGKWILENLLGAPPPPPPANVPDLKAHGEDGKPLTMRAAMEQHRADPVCASCHARMDPLGFAMENFDGVGKWRAEDAGHAIDVSGTLPDGTKFVGPAGLKKLLETTDRDQFVSTVTSKLLTYALGRGLEYYDQPAVRAIDRDAAHDNYTLSSLITAIVKSTPFQMRRTQEP